MLLDELFALRKADKAEREQLLSKLDRMNDQLLVLTESLQAQAKVIAGLKKMITDLHKQNKLLQKENAVLKEQKRLSDKNRFGRKSQKFSSGKNVPDSRESDKEDFDSGLTPILPLEEEVADTFSSVIEKESPYRRGMFYKRMKADKSLCHDFDFSRLPSCCHHQDILQVFLLAGKLPPVLWRVSVRTRCSLAVTVWRMCRLLTIP